MSTMEQLNSEEVKVQIGYDEHGNGCWFVPLKEYNLIQSKLFEAERTLRQQIAKIEQCERELSWVLEGIKVEDSKND